MLISLSIPAKVNAISDDLLVTEMAVEVFANFCDWLSGLCPLSNVIEVGASVEPCGGVGGVGSALAGGALGKCSDTLFNSGDCRFSCDLLASKFACADS